MIDIVPIRTAEDFESAVKRVSFLMEYDPIDETDELEILSALIHLYEEEHHKMDLGDPRALIRFKLKELGLDSEDMFHYSGTDQITGTLILNHDAVPSINEVISFSEFLKIPTKSLIGKW